MFNFLSFVKDWRAIAAISLFGLSAMFCEETWAVDYPTRPIRITVPYTPGGVTDLVARQLARSLEKDLKQPVVIENKPGAAGTYGAMQLIGASPDGYRLSLASVSIFRLPLLEKTPLDPMRQLTYIASLVDYTYFIVVREDSPWKTVGELVAGVKNSPTCTFGTTGVYSTPHVAMEEFQKVAGFTCTHVPFKGAAEVTNAILGGQISMAVVSGGGALDAFVGNGRLRLIASLAPDRAPMYPNVPTLRDAGVPVATVAPFGLVGPARMDPQITEKLGHAVERAMKEPSMVDLVNKNSSVLKFMGPKDYLAYANETWLAEQRRFSDKKSMPN